MNEMFDLHVISRFELTLILPQLNLPQKKFLNRIAGLDVARQNLVFSLFMSSE